MNVLMFQGGILEVELSGGWYESLTTATATH